MSEAYEKANPKVLKSQNRIKIDLVFFLVLILVLVSAPFCILTKYNLQFFLYSSCCFRKFRVPSSSLLKTSSSSHRHQNKNKNQQKCKPQHPHHLAIFSAICTIFLLLHTSSSLSIDTDTGSGLGEREREREVEPSSSRILNASFIQAKIQSKRYHPSQNVKNPKVFLKLAGESGMLTQLNNNNNYNNNYNNDINNSNSSQSTISPYQYHYKHENHRYRSAAKPQSQPQPQPAHENVQVQTTVAPTFTTTALNEQYFFSPSQGFSQSPNLYKNNDHSFSYSDYTSSTPGSNSNSASGSESSSSSSSASSSSSSSSEETLHREPSQQYSSHPANVWKHAQGQFQKPSDFSAYSYEDDPADFKTNYNSNNNNFHQKHTPQQNYNHFKVAVDAQQGQSLFAPSQLEKAKSQTASSSSGSSASYEDYSASGSNENNPEPETVPSPVPSPQPTLRSISVPKPAPTPHQKSLDSVKQKLESYANRRVDILDQDLNGILNLDGLDPQIYSYNSNLELENADVADDHQINQYFQRIKTRPEEQQNQGQQQNQQHQNQNHPIGKLTFDTDGVNPQQQRHSYYNQNEPVFNSRDGTSTTTVSVSVSPIIDFAASSESSEAKPNPSPGFTWQQQQQQQQNGQQQSQNQNYNHHGNSPVATFDLTSFKAAESGEEEDEQFENANVPTTLNPLSYLQSHSSSPSPALDLIQNQDQNHNQNPNHPHQHLFDQEFQLQVQKNAQNLNSNQLAFNPQTSVQTSTSTVSNSLPELDNLNLQVSPVLSTVLANPPTTTITPHTTDATSIPGIPGIDYPILSEVPYTGFDCQKQRYKGFFADIATKCQAWHYCDFTDNVASFLCPNGTLFSQVLLTCDWWFNVDCRQAQQLYVLNERLYRYIKPPKRTFPEDYHGPHVDNWLIEQLNLGILPKMKKKVKDKIVIMSSN